MPGAQQESLVIENVSRLDYDALRQAIHDATVGKFDTPVQHLAISEIRACRSLVSAPLSLHAERPPKPEDRNRIAGLAEVTITIAPDRFATPTSNRGSTIRLGADLVSVSIALSDELQINELDAGVLLYNARSQATHRADHDVVAAAKELFYLRRRESVLYLQEVVRAGLMATPDSAEQDDDNIVSALTRERDILVVEHNVITNILKRLSKGFEPANIQNGQRRNRMALQTGEAALLAETLFLLGYTVQLSSAEATGVRSLLDQVDAIFERMYEAEKESAKAHKPVSQFVVGSPTPEESPKKYRANDLDIMSPRLVEVESVRNLLLLAWTCALDRSRYHDIYDPRTGVQGVNALLKDLSFIPQTCKIPKLEDKEGEDMVANLSSARAAAELCGSVFRLAVAVPDEDEALWTSLRVSAYGGALSFLSHELAPWIGIRAGSLSPDADLYSDVLEDLALDIAEAPQLVASLINFTQNAVISAATETAYASVDDRSISSPTANRNSDGPFAHQTDLAGSTSAFRRASFGRPPSGLGTGSKPPRPPSRNMRPPSMPLSGGRLNSPPPTFSMDGLVVPSNANDAAKPDVGAKENLVASLAHFVAEAISLAPSKLNTDSIAGGSRYWSGIAASSAGLMHQIGDAVIDLWDASMRNPYAPGGVGEAFRHALDSFLHLLACTARKEGSPSHAAAALRFLRDSGQSAVSLERGFDAMTYFHNELNSPSLSRDLKIDDADVETLHGMIQVIANAAETLRPHGGVVHLLGDSGKDLAQQMATLAIDDIPPSLKATLLKALSGLDNRRANSYFLETVANDKASLLRRFLRETEAQTGAYDMTIQILNMTAECVQWSDDEFPDIAVESITRWFAIEEVLTFWSRRKYCFEAHRWRLVRAAASLIFDVIHRNPTSECSFRILAGLLTSAPGTGAASYALKALLYTSALMRAGDEKKGPLEFLRFSERQQSLYHVTGRDSLIHAAEHGLGEAYREMQMAAQTAARMISLVLSVPPGRISVPGSVVAPASELLLSEVKAISCATSLVFAIDGFVPSIAKAGFAPSVCAAILGMLAKAAQESSHIAGILARDAPGSPGSAAQFRTSLANIIARSPTDASEIDHMGEAQGDEEEISRPHQDAPIMHSALRIVEASLGMDGGGAPGLFLLGLRLDSSGLFSSAEYGVLGALVELVAGAHDANGRVDDKSRSTAATFLERLAANTVRRTSLAVLEHLRLIAQPDDSNVRGGGFADEMLFRVLEAAGTYESAGAASKVDWPALGELLTACLSLGALQVRLFQKYEVETCISRAGMMRDAIENGSVSDVALLPSPIDLLNLLALIGGSGEMQVAVEGLRTWCHLLITRLGVHPPNSGYSSVPVLFELTHVLLGALSGTESGSDLVALIKKDGGEMAASISLLCISRMRDCDNPHEPGSEEYIGDVQCTSLLTCVVRALSGVVGIGTNASRARTSLYAALLVCASLAKTRVSDDAIGRAFGGRYGPRQTSGTEAVIAAACADAESGPTAASKAAAMSAASMIAILDPARALGALGAQNRLRRVIEGSLGDEKARKLISRACSEELFVSGTDEGDLTQERAAVVVGEAAIALIHAVASGGHGARLIADSSVIESAGSLLPYLGSGELIDLRDTENELVNRGASGEVDERDGGDAMDRSEEEGGNAMDVYEKRKNVEEGDKRMEMIGSVTTGIAAAMCCANMTVVDATMAALDGACNVYCEVLRAGRFTSKHDLKTIGSLGVILSRIPYEMIARSGSVVQLRTSLASVLGGIIPGVSKGKQVGSTVSEFGGGYKTRRGRSEKEMRRMQILHPEGGTLFERDLIMGRAACAENVIAALRYPGGLTSVFVFDGHLGDRGRVERQAVGGSRMRSTGKGGGVAGRLSEVVRICQAAINETKRCAEECGQMERRIAGEEGRSMSSRQISQVAGFCSEEFGIGAEQLNGRTVLECLRKASAVTREHADRCIGIFEGGLFILREFVRTARETVRASASLSRRLDTSDDRPGGGMSAGEAERLVGEARVVVVPMCKEVEGLGAGVWGGRDAAFCRQVCRQIRTACTGERG